jgi:hypothetical protein
MKTENLVQLTTTAIALNFVTLDSSSFSSTGRPVVDESRIVYYEHKSAPHYISPKKSKSIIDFLLRVENPLNNQDIKFIAVIQELADRQIDLSLEFSSSLKTLALKVGNKKLTKRRF